MTEVTTQQAPLTFIDIFCGIGGIRLGFEKANCKCIFSCEKDIHAKRTYAINFNDYTYDNVTLINTDNLDNFDILCGGFPCQTFSTAGKREGFEDKIKGTLFFELSRILNDKKPQAFFFENVVGLLNHDKGNTFKTIQEVVEKIGYTFYYKKINSKLLVPQNRERIYMIGFKDKTLDFKFPEIPDLKPKLIDILENNVSNKYTLTPSMWKCLQEHKQKSINNNNGFGYTITNLESYTRTLTSHYHKDASEILINKHDEIIIHNMQPRSPNKPSASRGGSGHLTRNDNITYCLDTNQQVIEINSIPRRLTPRECARLQGFPETFKIDENDNQAYKQFGNSVTVPIIEYLAKQITKTLIEQPKRKSEYKVQSKLIF